MGFLQREDLAAGDEISVHIAYSENRKLRHWLLNLEWLGNTENIDPDAAASVVLYASTGDVFEFDSEIAEMVTRIVGPYEQNGRRAKLHDDIKDQNTQVPLDYLTVGFDNLGQLTTTLREQGFFEKGATNLGLGIRGRPYPESVIEKSSATAREMGVLPIHIKSFAGFGLSMQTFFRILSQMPVLEDLVRDMVGFRTMLSILGGQAMNLMQGGPVLNFANQSQGVIAYNAEFWGLEPDMPCYRIPVILNINGNPTLWITLYVTTPRAPFKITAGVVGLVATPPKADADKRLIARVVGTGKSS